MNKLKALIITGSFEVRFEGQEKLLKEVANLQKHILEDDVIHTAIDFGRLKEIAKTLNIDEDEEMKKLHNLIILKENEDNLDLEIGQLEFTVRTYNVLQRAGIQTVSQIVSMSLEDLRSIHNMNQKSFIEVVKKLEKLGFELVSNEKQ